LRYLALGVPVNGLTEGSELSREALDNFFGGYDRHAGHAQTEIGWFRWFVERFQEEWVQPPRTPGEIEEVQQVFGLCGFPGAISSMDAVHIPWDNAPSQENYLHKGKEGYATLVWNVNVTHSRRIIHVRGPYAGGKNDKTLVRDDAYIRQLRTLPIFTSRVWHTYIDMDLGVEEHTGVHCINDGGYHKWMATMHAENPEEAGTLELENHGRVHEGVRKDFECTFGIMKRRRRVLKVPSLLSTDVQVDHVFRTCTILHNMLLQFDNLDTLGLEEGDWELVTDLNEVANLEPNVEGLPDELVEEDVRMNDIRVRMTAVEQLVKRRGYITAVDVHTDRSLLGQLPLSDEPNEEQAGYTSRKNAIAKHVHIMFRSSMLMRLKHASEVRVERPAHGAPGPWHDM